MSRLGAIILLVAAAASLIFGMVLLFDLRYEAGDVYPPYSSLRSDPLGTMALYEALAGLPGLTVERDLSPGNTLPPGNGITYLHIAAPISEWSAMPDDTYRELELFVSGGGRLVIALFPQGETGVLAVNAGEKKQEKPKPAPFRDRWGVDFKILDLPQQYGEYAPADVKSEAGPALPAELQWHSGVVVAHLSSDWKVIYRRGTAPVVVERQIGRGTAVIATDSYFFSNEAMQKDRHPDLLAWLVGSNRTVIFDEAHLGVTETPGIATLVRRYRLHWFVAALIVLAALFIWKNAVSLVPPPAGGNTSHSITGKDTAAGFISLLQRSIPSHELLSVCVAQWRTSKDAARRASPDRIERAGKIIEAENARPAKERDPVQAYREISKILQAQHSNEYRKT